MIASARTTVGRLRVRGSGLDAVSARLRAETVLGSAALQPSGLPPAAVLCVRRLPDPRPGSLGLGGDVVGPPGEWEEAMRGALARAAAGAARPAREMVPAGANAVLFADRAELLAALARDAAAGVLGEGWWWVALARGAEPARVVADAWLEAPEYVPAAVALLESRGEAATVRVLAPADARLIAERAAMVFGRPPPEFAEHEEAHEPDSPAATECGEEVIEPAAPDLVPAPVARLPGLAVEHRVLLAVALAVAAPAVAARRLEVVSSVPEEPERRTPSARPAFVPDAASADLSEPPHKDSPVAAEIPARPSPVRIARVAAARSEAPAGDARVEPGRAASPPIAAAPVAAAPNVAAPTSVRPGAVQPPAAEPAAPSPDRTVNVPEPWSTPSERPLPAPIATELGGLFFLVNLALALELYGDFTTPAEPGIALDPWDFVTLIGAELLDATQTEDPVWELLAALAGRGPRERPGAGFTPPPDWRLPPGWLAPFPATEPTTPWRWSGARGRARAAHPAGFLVLDVPGGERELRAALRPYRPRPALRRASLPRESVRPLGRWVGRVTNYARARLALADLMPALLFRLPADVHVSPAHVDVVIPLADLALEVRLAGLDRDPGFIPAAGRHLAFHFR